MSPLDVSAPAPHLDLFSLWNAKLLDTFFSCASPGDEVWLQIDSAELDLIGPELGGDEGFLNAVRSGPSWPFIRNGRLVRGNSADLVHRLQALVRQRLFPADKPRDYIDPGVFNPVYLGCKAPTYLPFLAALVRSSALYKKGYYEHLRKALELPDSWNSSHLAQLDGAWDDLQKWTRETNGRFGRFVPRKLGGYAHVGLPRAQCLMSRQDREESSRIFELAGLRSGQAWSRQVAHDVISYASEELSASFRDALSYKELRGPIEANLRSLFEEWDGTASAPSHRSDSPNELETSVCGQIELALSLPDGTGQWQAHWRVPPFREGSDVFLEREGIRWKAQVWGNERCSTLPDSHPCTITASHVVLAESALQDVYFQARLEEEGAEPVSLGRFVFPKAELRTLAWGFDYATQREELQECPLPRYGCAYLLATQRVAQRLFKWLQQVEHQVVKVDCLPVGWVLACVNDCSTLTEAQIDALPGAVGTNSALRPLAIVGGRSVTRASKRQYLSYDLPSLELDAPLGTTLRTSAALGLEELSSVIPDRKPGVRRFRMFLLDSTQKSFQITATNGNRELASITLRIAPDGGEQVTLGGHFSLDPQGHPQRTLSGLHGGLDEDASIGSSGFVNPLLATKESLGTPLHPLSILKIDSNPAVLFLDSLAKRGTLAYGTAKDQLTRLLFGCGESMQPDKVLLDLRCRGHIEIETSPRGHFTRIHAVRPALYQLPLITGGRQVYAVLGSLTRQQWRSLVTQVGLTSIYQLDPIPALLPTWRILTGATTDADRIGAACGMASLPTQSMQIATWAANSDDVRIQIEHGAVESIGALEHNPQRLHPGKGYFIGVDSLAPRSACDLFRMDDRDIIRGRVYVLATRKENVARYGFLRDSRWGVWIALQAFAKFVKETFSIDDACPWPIPYSAKEHTLLLPARISLPVVLERALVLCSGQAPEVVEAKSRSIDQRCIIVRQSDGKSIAVVSQVYSEMADGKWLLYKSVPSEVATIVANKLGATLATS